jgi:hypothetical protein
MGHPPIITARKQNFPFLGSVMEVYIKVGLSPIIPLYFPQCNFELKLDCPHLINNISNLLTLIDRQTFLDFIDISTK